MKVRIIAAVLTMGVSPLEAGVLDLSSLDLVAKIQTRGHYDNQQLSYWNGQPLSPSNHPSAFEDELTASLSFYVDPAQHHRLYLAVTNVRDTNFGFISGAPFNLVALTGVSFSLPGLAMGTLDSSFALPGELLVGPTSGASTPLSATPGWSLSQSGHVVSLKADAFGYGLTHFNSVFGDTRIYGGAVFAIDFVHGANLVHRDYRRLSGSASNGMGAYEEVGSLVYARGIPEPSTWALMLGGFGLIGGAKRYRRKAVVTFA